jgi:hypothetical protein
MNLSGGMFKRPAPRLKGHRAFWFHALPLALFLSLLWFSAPACQSDDEAFTCVVCGKRLLSGKAYRHPAGPVCEICVELLNRCSLCGLPIKDKFGKTSDGRFICKFDLPNTIKSEAEAQRLFEDVHNGLYRLTGGELKLKNSAVAVSLFDIDYWNYRDGNPVPDTMRRLGFSQSRPSGETLSHSVVLLSGQLKSDTTSVCAHEFMHLWINENNARNRSIEGDTLEALCELTAYKWMVSTEDRTQQQKILGNVYTHGKIKVLIGLETDYGFPAILDWVKRATNAVIDAQTLSQLGSPRISPVPVANWALRVQEPVQTLRLLGVIGSKTNRCALINNRQFFENDEKELTLGSRTILVKCLEIKPDSVRIVVAGTNAPVTLTVGDH